MENPLAKKSEEIVHGGQMAIVLGFVATFLLGVVFVYVMGNLLDQISVNVKKVNLQLSGANSTIYATATTSCLTGIVRGENADILDATNKTAQAKTEDVLNRYTSAAIAKLSVQVKDCANMSVPSFLQGSIQSAAVAKNGEGLTVEAALQSIVK